VTPHVSNPLKSGSEKRAGVVLQNRKNPGKDRSTQHGSGRGKAALGLSWTEDGEIDTA